MKILIKKYNKFIIHNFGPKSTPYDKGISFPKFIVHVDLLIYYFHESLPLSLPPPVSFSPPKAPPISAPDGPTFTLTNPQSEPEGPIHLNTFYIHLVNIQEDKP